MDESLCAVRYIEIQPMELKPFLNRLQDRYHRTEFLGSDPLEFPHRYSDPWDQEAVALLSAVLAYGNVKQIRRSVEEALSRINRVAGSPSEFVRRVEQDPSFGATVLKGFVHRFNVGEDVVLLLAVLGRSWRRHGSLGGHFLSHLSPEARDFSVALTGLIEDWKREIRRDPTLSRIFRKSPSFSYFLTAPSDGSCCKRWCMFLRWMGRKDDLDLGLWGERSPLSRTFPVGRFLKPSQLILPLDTHTGRISQYIGLTRRKSLNWLAAVEVTESLRQCDPEDPSKYDFALSRLGILDVCRRKYDRAVCEKCDLIHACRFAKAGAALVRAEGLCDD